MADLDLTNLLPQILVVRAGEKQYELNTDIPPALLFRIQRWFALLADEPPGSDEESVELTARALKISAKDAEALGGTARLRLLAFLAGGLGARTTTPLSKAPSPSSSPSAEA